MGDYQRAEQLVNLPSLGDRRPSQLMNTMLALLPGGYTPGFIFNFLFQQRMPADVRGLLAAQRIKDPRELAARADEYWVVRQWNSTITSVGPVLQEEPVVHYPDDGILAVRNQSTGRKNVRSNRPRPTTENEICWFHRKWELKPIHAASHALFVPRETDKPAGRVRFHSRRTHPRNLTASLSPRYSFQSSIPSG